MNFPNVFCIFKICRFFSKNFKVRVDTPHHTTPTVDGNLEATFMGQCLKVRSNGRMVVPVGFTVAGLTPRGFEPSFYVEMEYRGTAIHGWNFWGLLGERDTAFRDVLFFGEV